MLLTDFSSMGHDFRDVEVLSPEALMQACFSPRKSWRRFSAAICPRHYSLTCEPRARRYVSLLSIRFRHWPCVDYRHDMGSKHASGAISDFDGKHFSLAAPLPFSAPAMISVAQDDSARQRQSSHVISKYPAGAEEFTDSFCARMRLSRHR